MTDIVERLRDGRYGAMPSQRAEAADEIERLRMLLKLSYECMFDGGAREQVRAYLHQQEGK